MTKTPRDQWESSAADKWPFWFDHVGVSVTDLEHATSWWCSALDLVVEYSIDPPDTELSGTMLLHPSGFRIELLHQPGAASGPTPLGPVESAATLGFGHVCLRVTDVPAAFGRLVARGALPRKPPAASPARAGATNAFVADPDGNLIEILDRPQGALS